MEEDCFSWRHCAFSHPLNVVLADSCMCDDDWDFVEFKNSLPEEADFNQQVVAAVGWIASHHEHGFPGFLHKKMVMMDGDKHNRIRWHHDLSSWSSHTNLNSLQMMFRLWREGWLLDETSHLVMSLFQQSVFQGTESLATETWAQVLEFHCDAVVEVSEV